MFNGYRRAAGWKLAATSGFLVALSLPGAPPPIPKLPPAGTRIQRSGPQPRDDHYQFISIDVEGSPTFAFGINNHRVVSGYHLQKDGTVRTFIWEKGQMTIIEHPEAENTAVVVINDLGILFGNWGTITEQHAGSYNRVTNTWTQLPDIDGKPINMGNRMNDRGIAVGSACEGDWYSPVNCIGWTWDGKNYSFFEAPGATGLGTFPTGINNRGIEAGYWTNPASVPHSYVRYRDEFAPIEVPGDGSFAVVAYDINNVGQVLIWLVPNDKTVFSQPCLWYKDGVTELQGYEDPQSLVSLYQGINDSGDFAGFWIDASFGLHGLVALRK